MGNIRSGKLKAYIKWVKNRKCNFDMCHLYSFTFNHAAFCVIWWYIAGQILVAWEYIRTNCIGLENMISPVLITWPVQRFVFFHDRSSICPGMKSISCGLQSLLYDRYNNARSYNTLCNILWRHITGVSVLRNWRSIPQWIENCNGISYLQCQRS